MNSKNIHIHRLGVVHIYMTFWDSCAPDLLMTYDDLWWYFEIVIYFVVWMTVLTLDSTMLDLSETAS